MSIYSLRFIKSRKSTVTWYSCISIVHWISAFGAGESWNNVDSLKRNYQFMTVRTHSSPVGYVLVSYGIVRFLDILAVTFMAWNLESQSSDSLIPKIGMRIDSKVSEIDRLCSFFLNSSSFLMKIGFLIVRLVYPSLAMY